MTDADTKAQKQQDEIVWADALHWVEAGMMQVSRVERAAEELTSAYADAKKRKHFNREGIPDADQAWRSDLDGLPDFDRERPFRVPTIALTMQVTAEIEFMFVALRNVMRANDVLPATDHVAVPGDRTIATIRNVMEHWDEVGGHSITQLPKTAHHKATVQTNLDLVRLSYPGDEADAIQAALEANPLSAHTIVWVAKGEVRVGGFTTGELRAWLETVGRSLRAALQTRGKPVPALNTSCEDGDDDIAWPPERFRGRLWQIPQPELEEWAALPARKF